MMSVTMFTQSQNTFNFAITQKVNIRNIIPSNLVLKSVQL